MPYQPPDNRDMFERLPPDVKREFLEKQRRLEARDEAYLASQRKKTVRAVAAWVFVASLTSLAMGAPAWILVVLLAAGEIGLMYWLLSRKAGHLACMMLPVGMAIVFSSIALAAGHLRVGSVFDFVRLLAGYGMFMGAGGSLGLWARTEKSKIPYAPPPGDDK